MVEPMVTERGKDTIMHPHMQHLVCGLLALLLTLAFAPQRGLAQQAEHPVACDEGRISEPIPLAYGDHTTNCEIGPEPTDTDQFSFVGAEGDHVRIRLLSLTADFDPRLEIRDPDGMLIVDHQCTVDRFNRCAFTLDSLTNPPLPVLSKAGTYLLTVSDNDGFNPGGYILQLERIPPAQTPPSIPYDRAVTDDIEPPTDVDFFTFDGVTGTEIRIRLLSLTADFDPHLEIRDPDGEVIVDHRCTVDRFNRCAFTLDNLTDPPLPVLTKSGPYLLTVSDDDGFNAGRYQIEIQCLFGPCRRIHVAPAAIDFGEVVVDASSNPKTVTVSNVGDADLVLRSIAIDPDNPDYWIQNDTCSGQAIPPAGQCTLEVVFSPASAGLQEALLTIPSDDPSDPVVEVPLSGTGKDGGMCLHDDSGQLNIRSVFVAPGEQSPNSVPVEVNIAPNDVRAFGFDVAFDDTKLLFQGFTPGELTEQFDQLGVNEIGPGRLRIGGYEAGDAPIAADTVGTLVHLTFTVKEGVAIPEDIPLDLQNLVDDIVPFSTSGGCITTGCAHDGDVNGDGEITPGDALRCFQGYLEMPPLQESCEADHADVVDPVDPGSDVTPADCLCIFQKFLGQPSCLDEQ
jgi:hypothetical protein